MQSSNETSTFPPLIVKLPASGAGHHAAPESSGYSEDERPQRKRSHLTEPHTSFDLSAAAAALTTTTPSRKRVLPKTPRLATTTSLYDIVSKLISSLKTKDSYGIFLEPVDTALVPDYLTVIKRPMDFSTMSKKLERSEYHNLLEFQIDFELICSNAMAYNAPNTIYYKAAQKLLDFGRRLIARESQKMNEWLVFDADNMNIDTESEAGAITASPTTTVSSSRGRKKKHLQPRVGPPTTTRVPTEHTLDSTPNALFARLADGTLLFSSLRKQHLPLSYTFRPDGSVSLGDGIDAKEFLIAAYHEGLAGLVDPPILGNSLSLLSAYIKGKSASSNIKYGPVPNALLHTSSMSSSSSETGFSIGGPWYSFSPFYESLGGFPVAPFESPGLALAYGDPKGRAYLESLERFLGNSSGDAFRKSFLKRKLDSLSVGGHSYYQKVLDWKLAVSANKEAKSAIASSSSTLEDVKQANIQPDIKVEEDLCDKTTEQLPLPSNPNPNPTLLTVAAYEQVKNDLNHLARLLRWKRIEPELEKWNKSPPEAIIRQFYQTLSLSSVAASSPSETPVPMDSNVSTTTTATATTTIDNKKEISEKLAVCSQLIVTLQHIQNERFRGNKPSAISNDEKQLVSQLRSHLVCLSGCLSPSALVTDLSSVHQVMTHLTHDKLPLSYSGTLPPDKPHGIPTSQLLRDPASGPSGPWILPSNHTQGLNKPILPWSTPAPNPPAALSLAPTHPPDSHIPHNIVIDDDETHTV